MSEQKAHSKLDSSCFLLLLFFLHLRPLSLSYARALPRFLRLRLLKIDTAGNLDRLQFERIEN